MSEECGIRWAGHMLLAMQEQELGTAAVRFRPCQPGPPFSRIRQLKLLCMSMPAGPDVERSSLVAVGTWSMELVLLGGVPSAAEAGSVPAELKVLAKEQLAGEVIPRR